MYYDNYGLFAITSFDSIPYNESVTYKVWIYKKNFDNPTADIDLGYPGAAQPLVCGADPLILRTLNDEAFGIKGSELELTILNINNQTPLSTFYSEEDDTFRIHVQAIYGGGTITKNIFFGFLVQEDSSEVLTDFAHEIKLSFTDGLGTLKYVSFGEAAKWSPTSSTNVRVINLMATLIGETATTSPFLRLNSNQSTGSPAVGDYVVFMNSPIGYSANQIKLIFTNPLSPTDKRLYFTDMTRTYGPSTTKIAYVTGSDVYGRIKLADALRICLHACNLNLDVYFGNSISAVKESTEYTDIFNNVYVDGRSFLQDENNWKDCYEVLNEIMTRLQCSIFQSDGRWYIVRWNELRNFNNQIPFICYDGYFNQTSTIYYFPQTIEKVETGLNQTFLRPFNFYSDTLNYKQNSDLLKNSSLSQLGLKYNEYTSTLDGSPVTIYEYEFFNWEQGTTTNVYKPLIEITKDSIGNEIRRRILVRYISGNDFSNYQVEAIKSKTIECKKGDRLKFSFDCIIPTLLGGNTFYFNFFVTNGTSTYYITDNLQDNLNEWDSSAFVFAVPILSNNQITSVSVETKEIPIDGVFTFNFPFLGISSNTLFSPNCYFQSLQFEYIPQVSMQIRTIGHQHYGKQNAILKNNQNTEIYIDDTQKNSINGTLFFNAFQNLVQLRTGQWKDGQTLGMWPLGEILSRQMEDWRYKIRVKLEGKIIGIINSVGDYMVLYKALIFDVKAGKYFIFGKASYNFKEDTIDCTLYEMWDDTESRAGTGIAGNDKISYNFKYLYK